MRRNLRAALEEFVATHPGVRLGYVFGRPAAFVSHRVFARATDKGLQLRLPPAAAELTERDASAGAPSAKAKARGPRRAKRAAHGPTGRPLRAKRAAGWLTITPTSHSAARLEILLEQSARYVAVAGAPGSAAALGWP